MDKFLKTQNGKLIELDPQLAEELGSIGKKAKLQAAKDMNNDTHILSADVEIQEVKKEKKASEKEKQTEKIMGIADPLETFKDGNECYIKLPVKSHEEIWNINDSSVADWLMEKYYRQFGSSPSDFSINAVIRQLNARAKFDGEKHALFYRIASVKNNIWYDLTNDEWQGVEITPVGWNVVSDLPILFKRNTSQSSQVVPKKGGNLDLIFKYINISDEYKILFKAYLVTCFIPNIPHPIIALQGEAGGAKTTAARVIKKIVDPTTAEIGGIKKGKDMELSFTNNYWLFFDNLSKLSQMISDELCKAVTGANGEHRRLYSDNKTVTFTYQNCIALTCIDSIIEREDLLDRSLLLNINRITPKDRKLITEFWSEFEEDRPYILGAIFDILSKSLELYPTIKLEELSRMADFNKWAYVAAEAMTEGLGEVFVKQYKANMNRHNSDILRQNSLAAAILALMYKQHDGTWEGSASELLGLLKDVAYDEKIDSSDKTFPKSSVHVTRYLNRIKSNLEQDGIMYSHSYTSRKTSRITLKIIDPINKILPTRPEFPRMPVTSRQAIINYEEGEI